MNTEKYLESISKKKRVIVDYNKPEEGVKELLKIEPKVKRGFVGSFTISSKSTKIYKPEQPSITLNGTTLIGTEIAKYTLLLNFKEKGYRRETAELLEKTPPPLYAKPFKSDNLVYVDIRSCYFTLLKKLWNIKYLRSKYLGHYENREFIIPEEIKTVFEKNKLIRNSLYGLIRTRTRTKFEVENSKISFIVERSKNELFYPDVSLAILDITQSIARIAVENFSVYVAIDGFILHQKNLISFIEFLNEYGLQAGIKAEGEGEVKNFYTYKVGDVQTKNFDIIPASTDVKSNLIFSKEESKEILEKFKPYLTGKL